MDARVAEFIEKQKAAQSEAEIHQLRKEKEAAEKDKFILMRKLGLVEKEYFDGVGEGDPSVYPYYEWDAVSKVSRRYKFVSIKMTDEEYAELLKYVPSDLLNTPEHTENNSSTPERQTSSSGISLALKIFAGIELIGGAIAGIAIADIGYEFNFPLMLGIWAACGLGGCLLLGFAKVIDLLQEIRDKA